MPKLPPHDQSPLLTQLFRNTDRLYPWAKLAVALLALYGFFLVLLPGTPTPFPDAATDSGSSETAGAKSSAGGFSFFVDSFFRRGTAPGSPETAGPAGFAASAGKTSQETREYDVIATEKLIRFKTQKEMDDFLAKLKKLGLVPLDYSGKLLTVRILAEMLQKYPELLAGLKPEQLLNNHLVLTPDGPDMSLYSPLLELEGYGNRALEILGGGGGSWGKGVTVAILDTKIEAHPALDMSRIRQFNMLPGEDTGSGLLNGHGTAVTSIIGSTDPDMPGIAPMTDIIGYTVLDSDGRGDTFTLSKAIREAVDAGAQIINMSLGSYGDNPLVREAVEYAKERGVVVVAATGNDGIKYPSYPAAYNDVIGVGANDAKGQTAPFSNTGPMVDLTGPGYGVYTPLNDDQIASLTGTSAAAPFVTGTIAGKESDNPGMTPFEAAKLVLEKTDDKGKAGPDEESGKGALNAGRVIQSDTPGINDLALADFYLPDTSAYPTAPGSSMPFEVTAQNQGTEPFPGGPVIININDRTETHKIGPLEPGESVAVPTEVKNSDLGDGDKIIVKASVPSSQGDIDPSNNRLANEFLLNTPAAELPAGHH